MTFTKEDNKEFDNESRGPKFGIRHSQTLIIFIGTTIGYALRVNLNIAIVAMTDRSANSNFETFDWDEGIKSYILSSFYFGYLLNQIPGGQISKMYGCKYLLLLAIFMPSVICLLLPLVTVSLGWQALFGLRVLEGLCQGVLFPSVHTFLAHWVPVEERPLLGLFAYSGVNLGTAIMMAGSGSMASSVLGWPGIFYISGAIGLGWSIIWIIFGASKPAQHRTITAEEREFIEKSIGQVTDSRIKTIPTPWLKILGSKCFWGLLCAQVSQAWGFVVLLTQLPAYMHGVLEVDIKSNGLMSALPYFAMWVMGYIYVYIGDILYDKNLMSITALRKMFNSIGSCLPAIALIGLAFINKEYTTVGVVVLTVTGALNSAVGIGHALNHIDLAPQHAGVVMGMANTLCGITSLLTPIAIGMIVPNQHNQSQWQIAFFLSAAIMFFGNLMFVVFGTAEEQEWNDPEGKKKIPSPIHRRSSAFVEAGPCAI